ncbi:MAG: ThuA domain-containing protein [Candidatus Korobacteraceae bacterium]
MAELSRRNFLAAAGGAVAAAKLPLAAQSATAQKPVLRVQYTTGSHTVPLQQYEMFDDPTFRDLDTWVVPHPRAFNKINDPGGPEVIVLGDYLTGGWPEEDRPHVQKYLDAGKGLVVLHHAVGDNQTWPWWYEEVLGGALIQRELPGKPRSGLKQWPRQRLSPVGNHPIVRGIQPFTLPFDELFYNMWFSPKAQVLLRSDDPDLKKVNDGAIAWLGVHPKARVVCWQSGHTAEVNSDPRYRHIVHRMILWAGGKLNS